MVILRYVMGEMDCRVEPPSSPRGGFVGIVPHGEYPEKQSWLSKALCCWTAGLFCIVFLILLLVLFHNIVDEVFSEPLRNALPARRSLSVRVILIALAIPSALTTQGILMQEPSRLFSVLLAQYMSHRKYGILILENGFYNPESGHGDSVEGCALQGNNVRAAGLCLQWRYASFTSSFSFGSCRQEMVDGLACYVDTAPDRYLAVSVLTQDITLNITDIYVRTLA